MEISRLRMANNGLLEEHSQGPMVWFDDVEPLLMAARKLVECKGRFHTEQNYKALAEELERWK